MPLYEYECDDCGTRFERIQKFSDPPLATCPKCGKAGLHKLVSSPAIKFKGSGFYINDYAKKGSLDGEKTPSEKSSSTKDEKKPSAESSTPAAASSSSDTASASPSPATPTASKDS